MTISVKYTIAGAQWENMKILIQGETVDDLVLTLSDMHRLDEAIMSGYDRLVGHRDTRERVISHAANRLIVDELDAKILSVTPLEGAPEAGTEEVGPSAQPVKFWEREAPSGPTAGTTQVVKPVGKISLL